MARVSPTEEQEAREFQELSWLVGLLPGVSSLSSRNTAFSCSSWVHLLAGVIQDRQPYRPSPERLSPALAQVGAPASRSIFVSPHRTALSVPLENSLRDSLLLTESLLKEHGFVCRKNSAPTRSS